MPKIAGVNFLDAVRALRKIGFVIVREGKHVVMSNGEIRLTIPRVVSRNAELIWRVDGCLGDDLITAARRFVRLTTALSCVGRSSFRTPLEAGMFTTIGTEKRGQ